MTTTQTQTKRAAIYTRVSTDEQARKGNSLPSQLAACRRYAEQHGFTIVAEFTEDASGAYLERPELTKLRGMVRACELDAVIVYCLDRLTRSLVHALLLRDEFKRAGVERHTVAHGQAEDGPEAAMLENIESVFAEYERAKLRERITRGLHTAAKAGRHVMGGRPPFGYRYEGQRPARLLVVDDETAKIVRRIFGWYLHGDERRQPLSLAAIARRLSETGIPTPFERFKWRKARRKRAPCMWRATSVRQILRAEVYTGVLRFGRQMRENNKTIGTRKASECITIEVPAIVARETWQAVQDRLDENRRTRRKTASAVHLLAGMIRCATCAWTCNVTRRNASAYPFYVCSWRANHHAIEGGCDCGRKSISARKVDGLVWAYVLGLMTDPAKFDAAIELARRQQRENVEPQRDRLAEVEGALKRLEAEADNLIAGMKQLPKGGQLEARALAEIGRIEGAMAERMAERDQLRAALAAGQATDERIEAARRFRVHVVTGLRNASPAKKRRILRAMDVKVTVSGEQAQVDCAIPVPEGSNVLVIDAYSCEYAGITSNPDWDTLAVEPAIRLRLSHTINLTEAFAQAAQRGHSSLSTAHKPLTSEGKHTKSGK